MTTAHKGDPYQSPITLRTHAPRQTQEQGSPRLTRTRPGPGRSAALEDDNPDAWEQARLPSSARRYDLLHHQGRPSGKTTTWLAPQPTTRFHRRRLDRATLLIWCCLGVIIMLVGWWLLSLVAAWWQGVTDNWQYGLPRTFQTDHYVNQGDSPQHPDHFLALNVAGQVEVIQLNPRNPQLDHIYGITTTDDASKPVTLSFPLVDGKQEMDVSVGDSNPYTVRLVSNGKEFVAPGLH